MKNTGSERVVSDMENRVVHIRNIKKKDLRYIQIWMIYYAWVVAFTTWWTASPSIELVFGSQLRSILHSVNLISSAVFIFIIKKDWFVRTAKIGAVLLLLFMVVFMLVKNSAVSLTSAIGIGMTLGIVNCSILMPFVFTLNNTEKFYAVVGSFFLTQTFSLIPHQGSFTPLLKSQDLIYSFLILCAALSAVFFFKKEDIPSDRFQKEHIPKRAYLTILINVIFAMLFKGVGRGILNIAIMNSSYPVNLLYIAGGFLGCFLYIVLYAFTKKSIHIAWNITFANFAVGMLFNAFAKDTPAAIIFFAVLMGIGSTIGMINIYYILGVIAKKYNSMRYIQLSLVFIGLSGGVTGIVFGNLVGGASVTAVSMSTSIVSVCIMMLLLVLSPTLSRSYYDDSWVSDAELSEIANRDSAIFSRYHLTNREIEVCKLLLQGHTLRQISSILKIAYATVNTYYTSIYRKLNINSRAELILLFRQYLDYKQN